MTVTETFEIETDDGESIFTVSVEFSIEPVEYEGPYLFYAGGYTPESWSADGNELEVLSASFVGQRDGESVDDFILRYADENHEGSPPVSRYPVAM